MLRDVTKGAVVAGASVLFLILLVGLVGAFENESATVMLDLNTTADNQGVTTRSAAVDEEVMVEVYATVIDLKKFDVKIGFDPAKLSFVAESSTVESGFQVFPPALEEEGVVLAVGMLFVGTQSGDPLLLAKLVFKPLEGFEEAVLTVTYAGFQSPSGTDTPAQDATATITSGPVAALVSIAVTPETAVLAEGTVSFTATGTYDDESTADVTAEAVWTSSDEAVGTVDAGVFTAVAAGEATVTATIGDISGEATVTVAGLVSIAVTPETAEVVEGLTVSFTATGTYDEGSTADVTAEAVWTSDEAVGTVDAGVFTAVGEGEATVTATIGEVSGEATVTVTPFEQVPTALTLEPGDQMVMASDVGQGDAENASVGEVTYTATVTDQNGDEIADAVVEWTVENEGPGVVWIVSEDPAVSVAEGGTGTVTGASITLDCEAKGVEGPDPAPAAAEATVTAEIDELEASATVTWDTSLPVELASFIGAWKDGEVRLDWVAATQTNNLGWEVHRSLNGAAFAKMGFVKGAGTTSDLLSYAFADKTLPARSGTARYYLRQVNLDGTAGMSSIISVAISTAVEAGSWGKVKAQFVR